MKKLLASIILVNLLAACASEPTEPEAVAPEPAPVVVAEPVPAPAPAPVVVVDPLNDPNSLLSTRSTYYPFDVSAVQDSDKPVVQAHAEYLSQHSDRKVRLEGNCDERGSNEYNLALGQRRADGVKKMLVLGGARTGQIETVSYGEEKPRATAHNEAAWSQNRRTDIKY
ncbi:MAG: peptidoglycan-associated lipoprotein Pal [Gallionella sp.]